jgi:hypothetical protein
MLKEGMVRQGKIIRKEIQIGFKQLRRPGVDFIK